MRFDKEMFRPEEPHKETKQLAIGSNAALKGNATHSRTRQPTFPNWVTSTSTRSA